MNLTQNMNMNINKVPIKKSMKYHLSEYKKGTLHLEVYVHDIHHTKWMVLQQIRRVKSQRWC
jgi:hypothetical protein